MAYYSKGPVTRQKVFHMPAILLWRLGALGDSLLLLPALAACRAAFPAREIVVAGQPAALAPARWSGLADRIVDAAGPACAPLTAGEPARAGALPPDLELAVVWSARSQAIGVGLERSGARRVITAPALPARHMPVAEYYLATLAGAGVAPVPFRLRAPDTALAETEAACQAATEGSGEPIVVLHPGTGSALKCWPLAHFLALAALLRRAGLAVVWTAGPADERTRAGLDAAGEQDRVLPPLDVAGLSAVLTRAAVVVSGDCGVAHLAALLEVPSVALFGPTDPLLWGPPGARTSVLRLALPCSPCGALAGDCPTRVCLRRLPVAAVHAAVQVWLQEGASAGTAPHPGPSRPVEWCSPAPAPAPPGALPVQRWDHARSWGAGRPTGPG